MATLPQTAEPAKPAVSARRWRVSPIILGVALISLIPPLIVALVIAHKGVNVPRWDQWTNSVDLALHTVDGKLTFSDLLYQNFEPRLLLANLITAFLTLTTHWNIFVELYISFAIAIANCLLVLALIRREQPQILVWALIPVSLLMFSLRQHSNWLWGIQTSWFLMFLFFLLALVILQRARPGWKAVILTALMAFGSTWSMFQGLALWVLLPVLMWMYGYRRPTYYLFWLAAMAVTLGLYFSNYDWSLIGLAPTTNTHADQFYFDPIGLLAYVGAYLGNPFVPTDNSFPPLARVVALAGLILIGLNAIVLYRQTRRLSALAVWAGLVGFAFANAIMSGLGRAADLERAPWLPLLDRYVTPASLLWVALVAMAIIVIWRILKRGAVARWERALIGANLLLCVVLAATYLFANAWASQEPPLISKMNEECVVNYPQSRNTACMTGLWLNYMSLDRILQQIDELAARRLTIFAAHPPPYTEVIQARTLVPHLVAGDRAETGFRFLSITDTLKTIVLSEAAPGQVEFEVSLPQTDQKVTLYSAAYVDPADVPVGTPSGGEVVYRVGVRGADGKLNVLSATNFTGAPGKLTQISAGLNDYKGQNVRLVLQVLPAQDGEHLRVYWVDPIIFVMAPPAS